MLARHQASPSTLTSSTNVHQQLAPLKFDRRESFCRVITHLPLFDLFRSYHVDQVRVCGLEGCLQRVLTARRVRTLTGKEIELDIEPDFKVSSVRRR